jgi:nucleoside 2-deoxyribosyltransferase
MKITICASVAFSKEIVEIRNKLIKLGYQVIIPENVEDYASGSKAPETWQELADKKIAGNLIQEYFNEIGSSDCVLILNYTKNNIENYIGGNSFLEMGFAHVQNKPIYLLNPIPEMSYTDEIMAMKPIVINGDLTRII